MPTQPRSNSPADFVQQRKARHTRLEAAVAYDPALAKLSHPYRVLTADQRIDPQQRPDAPPHYATEWGETAYRWLVDKALRDPTDNHYVAKEFVRRFGPGAYPITDSPSSTYENTNYAILDYLRWRTQGRHFFQTTDSLDQALAATDIASDIPAQWLKAPYRVQFIQFGDTRSTPLYVEHQQTGRHVLEGAYVTDCPLVRDSGAAARFLTFTFIGSPLGKANLFDDAVHVVTLLVEDEAETLDKMIAESLQLEGEQEGKALSLDEKPYVREMVYHLAKVLLYLNTEAVTRVVHNERSELLVRAGQIKSPAKLAKLQRQAQRAYDRIIIGPKTVAETSEASAPTGRRVASHWRRGHFREQPYGEKRLLRRLIWLQPTLINAALAVGQGAPTGKPYVITDGPTPVGRQRKTP